MQNVTNNLCVIAILSLLIPISCNEAISTPGKGNKDTTPIVSNRDTLIQPAYNPARYMTIISDTLNIKMYEFTIKPGDSAALHTHPDHAVYVLQGGQLAVTFKGVGRQILDLKMGTGFISGPIADAGKNTGSTTVKLLVTDIHRPRAN